MAGFSRTRFNSPQLALFQRAGGRAAPFAATLCIPADASPPFAPPEAAIDVCSVSHSFHLFCFFICLVFPRDMTA
jgi:hypothetical protein